MSQSNYNIKIKRNGGFYICNNNIQIDGPFEQIKKINNNIYLIKDESSYKIKDYIKNIEIDFKGKYPSLLNRKLIKINEENQFRIFDIDSMEFSTNQLYNIDKYNIKIDGKYTLYENKLYINNKEILDLQNITFEAIENHKYTILNNLLIINPSGNFKVFEFSFNIEIKDIQEFSLNSSFYGNFSFVKITDIYYIFNSNNEIIIEENIISHNFNQGSPDFFWFKTKNNCYVLTTIISKPMPSSEAQIRTIFFDTEKIVIPIENKIFEINAQDGNYTIYENPLISFQFKKFDSKNPKQKLILNKGNKRYNILIENGIEYFFNDYNHKIEKAPNGSLVPQLTDGKISFIDFFNISKEFIVPYTELLDYSYCENEIVFIFSYENEYIIHSSNNELLYKSKKQLEFHLNWGDIIFIEPKTSSINALYFNKVTKSIDKFPFKIKSFGLVNSRNNLSVDISVGDYKEHTSIDLIIGINPILD